MLPRVQRLSRQEDILAVIKRGRCLSGDGIRVCVLKNGAGHARVALVVGKKVSAKAVVRHKLQRWLREAAREKLAGDLGGQSLDMVWVMQPGADKIESSSVLRARVDVLGKKLGWQE